MQAWAHRGCGQGPAENSLWAFEQALNAGFKAVELDVMLSADGVPMVHHDWQVGRCAQYAGVTAAPAFASLNFAELEQYHVAGAPVPTLQAVAAFCIAHGLQANVELKATHPHNAWALGHAVAQTLLGLNNPAVGTWVYSSFYHASLLPFKALGLNWPLALLYETLPSHWVLHAQALGAAAVHLADASVNPVVVQRVQATGRAVRVYTVNNPERLHTLASWGVAGYFTDRLDLALFAP